MHLIIYIDIVIVCMCALLCVRRKNDMLDINYLLVNTNMVFVQKLNIFLSYLFLLIAMAAIASGICFIALRDLDKTSRAIYPLMVVTKYTWSFIIGWVATGLCLLEGFVFLCLLRMDYEDVGESGRYHTM